MIVVFTGGYCRTNSDCVLGNKCIIQNPYYSQCLPDPTQYRSGNCLQNWGTKCSATSDCCDPGSTCNGNNNPNYPQCVQIQSPSCVFPQGYSSSAPPSPPATLVPTSTYLKGAPTSAPTAVISSQPSAAPFSAASK